MSLTLLHPGLHTHVPKPMGSPLSPMPSLIGSVNGYGMYSQQPSGSQFMQRDVQQPSGSQFMQRDLQGSQFMQRDQQLSPGQSLSPLRQPQWGVPSMSQERRFNMGPGVEHEQAGLAASPSNPAMSDWLASLSALTSPAPSQPPPEPESGRPRGWQPLPGAPSTLRLRQLDALHEESFLAVPLPPQLRAQFGGGSPSGDFSPGISTGPPPNLGAGARQPQSAFADPRRARPPPGGDLDAQQRYSRESQEPGLVWGLWKALQDLTGLTDVCMNAQVDHPRSRSNAEAQRPAPLREFNGQPAPLVTRQGSISQSHQSWCARSDPGLLPSSQNGCAPAKLVGVREEDNQVSNGSPARPGCCGQRAMSGREVTQVLQGACISMCSLKGNKDTAPNQDRAFCMNLRGSSAEIFAVFDGHGSQGHTIAEVSCEVLPKLVLHGLARGAANAQEGISSHCWKEVASQSFEEMHDITSMLTSMVVNAEKDSKDLQMDPAVQEWMHLDARASGSTATVVMMLPGQRLLVASVGDSRAMLAKRRRGGGRTNDEHCPWNVIELTRDHKPDLHDEQMRIEEAGAQVVAVGNEQLTIHRVYTPQQGWPSINMSRSIGDLHAHTQGLTAKAEAPYLDRLWDPETEEAVLIVASDGIWDVMDGVMAVETAVQHQANGKDAAAALAADAVERWMRRNLVGKYSDDITAIVKFL